MAKSSFIKTLSNSIMITKFMNLKKMMILIIILLTIISTGCINEEKCQGKMKILSSAFENNNEIPGKYTCDGDDISPPLDFQDIPNDTVSLVIIMDDIDANNFVHWLIWNIPSNISGFKENGDLTYPQGRNNFGYIGYGGPCPPSGIHHYRFTLYAIDIMLNLQDDATKQELEEAMSGHILEKAELIGLYGR